MTNKDIVVNIQEVANMWTNIAMGCKALFYLSASVLIILYIIGCIKNWK